MHLYISIFARYLLQLSDYSFYYGAIINSNEDKLANSAAELPKENTKTSANTWLSYISMVLRIGSMKRRQIC